MIPINNSKNKKGSFKGDPNGFISGPLGTLFRRRQYQYKILYPGARWQDYTQFYYEPNQGEFDNDLNETIWIKTSKKNDKMDG